MRVIEIAGGAGPAEALVVAERPDPEAGPGQIRIRVRASGVNRPDLVQRRGLYQPPPGASDVLGLEAAGEVDQVGDGVDAWSMGDRVCALLGRDLKDQSFSGLFTPEARREIEDMIAVVAEETLPVIAGITATSEYGETAHLELLLLPFSPRAHAPVSLTGVLAPSEARIAHSRRPAATK